VTLPRLRQAVLAARELEPVAQALRSSLGLGEPFADPGVARFGLRNAVFALGDTFLEIVSPTQPGTAAGRQLERRGGDCGYMLMFQVPDVAAARGRAAERAVRAVFEVSLPEMSEVHLHPADMRGAIVSLSQPKPPESWLWGGPDWHARSAPARIVGASVAVRDAAAVGERWRHVVGGSAGVSVVADAEDRGPVEVRLAGAGPGVPFEIAGVRFTSDDPGLAE
jgi:hypothetical protein